MDHLIQFIYLIFGLFVVVVVVVAGFRGRCRGSRQDTGFQLTQANVSMESQSVFLR